MGSASGIMNTCSVRKIFDYRDGHLYWKERSNMRHSIENPAGTVNSIGYRVVTYKGKKIHAHRLIWLWHGKDLPKMIDHINGDTTDNRIENLRPSDNSTNQCNSKLKSLNTSGVRGVSWCNTYNKWVVQIRRDRKVTSARFKDFNDAVSYAETKRRQLHGEFFSERRI